MNRELSDIRAILFDFGGVLAEEGYHQGLLALGRRFGLDPEGFFEQVTEIIYSCGYVTGKTPEASFWALVRKQTGVTASDQDMRQEILQRFLPRPGMLGIAANLDRSGRTVVILSDQTNWLDELDATYDFFRFFEAVYNSFHLGMSKRQPEIFPEIVGRLGLPPGACLFVDDNPGHIQRARQMGLAAHLFTDEAAFAAFLEASGLLSLTEK